MDRPMRAEVPFPTSPPYTAFVGNLSFDVTEGDLLEFFASNPPEQIRLVTGHDGRPKGFGYVEFKTADDLRAALDMTGQEMGVRPVRISVAESQQRSMGRADAEESWTRTGPLPPSERSGGFGDRSGAPRRTGGFDDMPEIERDAPIRGGKFVPSAEPPRRSGGFGSGGFASAGDRSTGDRPPRRFDDAPEVERDAPIRGGKFIPSAAPPAPERPSFGQRSSSGQQQEPSRADTESTWSRGTALPPRNSPNSAAGPPQRRKLELQARSATTSASASADSSTADAAAGAASSSKASPFGGAKPVDSTERERQLESKLAEQRAAAAAAAAEKEKLAKEKQQAKDDSRRGSNSGAAAASEGAWRTAARPASSQGSSRRPSATAPNGSGASRKPSGATSPPAQSPPPATSAPQQQQQARNIAAPAHRKEGFSYSSMAGGNKAAGAKSPEPTTAEQLADKVAETKV